MRNFIFLTFCSNQVKGDDDVEMAGEGKPDEKSAAQKDLEAAAANNSSEKPKDLEKAGQPQALPDLSDQHTAPDLVESQLVQNLDSLQLDADMASNPDLSDLDDDEDEAFLKQLEEKSEAELLDQWRSLEAATAGYASSLCEQLRVVLEPTLKARMQGDYKTGKRISMRKVIAYIASRYRRDKIWLRRTKPSKRQYQVMVSLDNSRSMAEGGVGRLALEAVMTICQALVHVEVGDFGVVSYGGQQAEELLPLGGSHASRFDYQQARPLLQKLTF